MQYGHMTGGGDSAESNEKALKCKPRPHVAKRTNKIYQWNAGHWRASLSEVQVQDMHGAVAFT